MSKSAEKKTYLPLIAAIAYILITLVWILLSDRILLFLINDEELFSLFQGLNIILIVGVSGGVFYYFINNLYKKSINRELVFESILGNAVIGLCEFDNEKIIFSNKVFKNIFDFNESDLRLSLTDLVHHSSVANLKEAVVKVINGSESESILVYPITSKKNLYQVTITKSKSDKTVLLTGIVTKAEKNKKEIYSREVLSTIIKRLETATNEKQLYYIALEEIAMFTNADAGIVFIDAKDEQIEIRRFINQASLSNTNELVELFSKSKANQTIESKTKQTSLEIILADGAQKVGLIRLFKSGESRFTEEETNFAKEIEYDLAIKIVQHSHQIRLQQNENQLHQLLESVKISIWYLDCERNELIRTKNLHIISNEFSVKKDNEALHWDSFLLSIHPDFRVQFENEINQLKKTSNLASLETKFDNGRGVYSWFLTNAKLFSDEITGKNFVIGITSNINHLKISDEIIKNSEKTYKDLFESNPASLLIFSVHSLLCIDANETAQFMYGLTIRQLLSKSIFDLMPDEDARRFSIPFDIVTEYGFFRLGLWRHKKRNNDLMYVDLSVSIINYKGEQCYMLLVTDVTNEILQQKEISKSESKYRQLFEKNPQPLLLLDKQLELISDANQTAIDFLQIRKDQIVQKSFSHIWGERMAQNIEELVFSLNTDYVAKKEVKLVLGNKIEKNVELTATRTIVDDKDSILLFMFDTTELKQAEQRTIMAFVEGEDKERERVAKELHDSLGQVLTAASMNMKSAQKELSEISFKRKEQFNKGLIFIQQAIDDTRSIAQNLMPKSISDYGLVSSINQLILSYKETLNFTISLSEHIGAIRFDKSIELNIYRIIQEALTNIIKYAQASLVSISLEMNKQKLHLGISDDGIGMELNEKNSYSGIGLKNMRSRVSIMHGELIIDSLPSNGTSITVIIPIENV